MSVNPYSTDYYAWTQRQVELLKSGRVSDLDVEHLIEEIESMGAREKKELSSRLEVLLMHLLKWYYQPQRRGKSWEFTIKEQRRKLADLLDENPSFKNAEFWTAAVGKAYGYALLRAEYETGLSAETFPGVCPFNDLQILDQSFWPQ
jgi:hypothetical protein